MPPARSAGLQRFAAAAAILAAVGYLIRRIHDWQHLLAGHAVGHLSDFALYYLQAQIGRRRGWSHMYDLAVQTSVARTIHPGVKVYPINYTPVVAWIAAPFTWMNVQTAYWVWLPIVVVAYFAAWYLLSAGSLLTRTALVILTLSLFPVMFEMTLAQLVPLQMLAFAVAFVLMTRGRDYAAGAFLSAITIHPQGWLLVPVALVFLRRWKVLAGLGGAAAVLAAGSVAMIGADGTRAFLNRISYTDHHQALFRAWPGLTIPSAVHSAALTALLDLLVVGLVAGTVWFGRTGDLRLPLAASVVGSLLVSPFEHVNDLILLVLAAALLTGWRLAPAGIFLALATLGLFVFAGAPTTTLRWGGILWGNLVVVVEALWLLGIYASAHATGPVRALRCLLPRTAPEPAAERSVALGAPSFG